MPAEVELKFALDPRIAAKVARLPRLQGVATGKVATRTLTSLYFDTPEGSLWNSQMTLRLRRGGRRWVQTLKGEGVQAGGLHTREESEHVVSVGTLDPDSIDDPALRKKVRKWLAGGELAPRFITTMRRTTWLLDTADGGVVECALDRGRVTTPDGRRSAPLCELELELKAGPPSALFALAREFAQSLPLALEERSKAERGYALWRRETWTQPAKAAPLSLPAHATVGDAMALIVGHGLNHLQRNWRAAQSTARYNLEHVHQMRVATRRLRTAFTLFARADGTLKTHPLVAELRWLAGLLGEARNWDVLLQDTFPKLRSAFPDETALGKLQRKAGVRRQQARLAVRAALHSPRYFALVLSLSEFTVTAGDHPALADRAATFAAVVLARYDRRLRKRARHIDAASAPERHLVRIAAKKVRYAAEFFGSLFSQRKLDVFLRRLSALQDALGLLNDMATARELLSELAPGADARTQHALTLCTGWSKGVEDGRSADLARRWKNVKAADRFWPAATRDAARVHEEEPGDPDLQQQPIPEGTPHGEER